MKQLEEITQRLIGDPMFAVTVDYPDPFNAGGSVNIVRNASGQQLAVKYGSVPAFWESLFAKGLTQLDITPRKQNGTKNDGQKVNYKTVGEVVKIALQPKGGNAASQAQPEFNFQPDFATPGMNAAFNPGMGSGMNAAQMNYYAMDYNRLLQEHNSLKAKFERLETEHKALEKENLKQEVMKTNKEGMVGMGKVLLEKLPVIMAAMKGQIVTEEQLGMAGPDPDDSPLAQLNAFCAQNPGMDTMLLAITEGVSTNEAFSVEIVALLRKHNLINSPENVTL